MSTTYTVQTGDVLLCDINSSLSGGVLTIPVYSTYTGGLCFNFHPGEDVQKTGQKTVYVVQKPGVPVGYEVGLGERLFTITTTIKTPTSNYANGMFRSLLDLNYLANFQYNKIVTSSSHASNGIIQFYYNGDGCISTFYPSTGLYPVVVKNFWYEQRPGSGKMFDVRIELSEVVSP
jgi:hypothetical protein